MDRSLRAKAAMEMVGTGILLSVISMAAVADSEKAPLAVVALLVGLIYMGFELSGAHYNPAVTLTFFLRNRFSPQASLLYILAQFSGALCGALFATFITGHTVSLKIAPAYSLANALFAELFFTAILCFSILTITLRSNSELHPIFGIAIAGVVLSGALLAGPISGGAFNPVVILVLSIVDRFSNFQYAVLASITHLMGAAVASSLFYFVAPEEFHVFAFKKLDPDILHGVPDERIPLIV